MPQATLDSAPVAATLNRLHEAARGDWKHMLTLAPRFLLSMSTGRDFMPKDPASLRHVYVPVSREQGRLMHLMARAVRARHIVEFGASFGISTLYLASAAKDNGGALVTTEIEPTKIEATRRSLAEAGLDDVVTLLEGDARETLKTLDGPVDFLFLDGMKPMYVEVLELLRERLTPSALVVADNVEHPSARAYTELVRDPKSGFESSTLFGGRLELSRLA